MGVAASACRAAAGVERAGVERAGRGVEVAGRGVPMRSARAERGQPKPCAIASSAVAETGVAVAAGVTAIGENSAAAADNAAATINCSKLGLMIRILAIIPGLRLI